ncbi:MAG TPA: ATP-binding cassette domain-containing protein [Candidatus Binataceae bacterium]|jgi:ABC-2 type transport system ATP-binding protein
MESPSAAIQARDLTKRFGTFTAVDHVNFEVKRGELFGLLGPNGAGKTTLSRMLTTLIVPTSGQGLVAGLDVAREPVRVREAIGVIPQALTSDMDLTGWENVDLYGGYYNLPRRVRRERAAHLIHMVGLTERANDLVQTYSGGMRRRLEIARGLIHSPQVLFLDEPTIGLDPQSRRAVWELLEQLRRDTGLTISLTTHYMDEAETLCDRIAIVDGGKIIAIGTPAELKAMVQGSDRIELEVQGDNEKIVAMLRGTPGVHEVTRDSEGPIIVSVDDGAHAMPKIIGEIENAGAAVTSIKLERMSLEDVFIQFTGRRLRDEPARKGGFFSSSFGMPAPPGR